MTELEILKHAKQYIDALANGVDPLSGRTVSENDVVNQVRISRCLFYVSGILQKVIDNGGEVQKKKIPRRQKAPFSLTAEQIASLKPVSTPLSATRVAGIFNEQIDSDTMQKLKGMDIADWLSSIELLTTVECAQGKTRRIPTSSGEILGMKEAEFVNEQGLTMKYTVYDKNAQQFIIDNAETLLAFLRKREQNEE